MCLIMNVNITRMFYMAAALVLFASCKTANQLTYFENVDNLPESEQALDYSTRIKPADELTITVNALVPEAAAPYNLSAVSIMKSGETSESSTPTKIQTYIVDKDGNISFPILGEVHAEGKTTKELANYLRSRIEKEIDNPIVNVQLVNFRVNVLGAVLEPGSIEVKSERFSVLDALAAAGDMTVQGKRDNVLLIRDNNGKREFHRLNLKDAGIVDYGIFQFMPVFFQVQKPQKEMFPDFFIVIQISGIFHISCSIQVTLHPCFYVFHRSSFYIILVKFFHKNPADVFSGIRFSADYK